ncbi:hypothetical protein HanIR_Chr13g0652451 [Helianthus annuus]|nr:hypothetical protein HanIR_Chr13g0652451 [Helianthus annuus]
MLQFRLKKFDVDDDVLDDGSMLKMIQKMFDVEHDVPDLKDLQIHKYVCFQFFFYLQFFVFCISSFFVLFFIIDSNNFSCKICFQF